MHPFSLLTKLPRLMTSVAFFFFFFFFFFFLSRFWDTKAYPRYQITTFVQHLTICIWRWSEMAQEKIRLAGTRGAGIMETKWDISDSCNGRVYKRNRSCFVAIVFVSDLVLHDRLGKFLWNWQTWSLFLIQCFFLGKSALYMGGICTIIKVLGCPQRQQCQQIHPLFKLFLSILSTGE
jgi:hypothetical protein